MLLPLISLLLLPLSLSLSLSLFLSLSLLPLPLLSPSPFSPQVALGPFADEELKLRCMQCLGWVVCGNAENQAALSELYVGSLQSSVQISALSMVTTLAIEAVCYIYYTY